MREEEFEKAFNSLKRNKAPSFHDVHVNIIKSVYNYIKIPLKRIFENSIKTGIFPEKMKIAKITPIFKSGQEELLTNYRPISVLPCFSKILERIMYNRLYTYLMENNLLFEKQFGFRSGHSTEHALVELIDKIHDAFNNNCHTLGIFIDLSKAFDTVDHEILLKKLHLYGVRGNSLKWFDSYLSNRKQYIEYGKISTDLLGIKCGVPQGSILGPLLFIIYVNDLYKVSTLLEPIMFADDTNLFLSHKNIKKLFETANSELEKIYQWFKANKLSLNEDKTEYMLFHKTRQKDILPLKLPTLRINEKEIKRQSAIKFLGVIFDENLFCTEHLKLIENKVSKNLGILFKAKHILNSESLKSLYFSFIHSYLNYGNIAWASTTKTKLKKLASKQELAVKTISANQTIDIDQKMKKLNILNLYKINIYQILIFMFKVKQGNIPVVFRDRFNEICHSYLRILGILGQSAIKS